MDVVFLKFWICYHKGPRKGHIFWRCDPCHGNYCQIHILRGCWGSRHDCTNLFLTKITVKLSRNRLICFIERLVKKMSHKKIDQCFFSLKKIYKKIQRNQTICFREKMVKKSAKSMEKNYMKWTDFLFFFLEKTCENCVEIEPFCLEKKLLKNVCKI